MSPAAGKARAELQYKIAAECGSCIRLGDSVEPPVGIGIGNGPGSYLGFDASSCEDGIGILYALMALRFLDPPNGAPPGTPPAMVMGFDTFEVWSGEKVNVDISRTANVEAGMLQCLTRD